MWFYVAKSGFMSAILDVRNSLSIAFLATSNRYATLFFWEIFDKMAAVGHFGCPKLTFDRISGHFRSIGHLDFLNSLSIAILAISDRYRILFFSVAILDARKSLLTAFLAISDRSAILDV